MIILKYTIGLIMCYHTHAHTNTRLLNEKCVDPTEVSDIKCYCINNKMTNNKQTKNQQYLQLHNTFY